MVSPVIDISHWQPEPDFAKVKAGGVVGVIMKATENTSYIDNTYYDRREEAKAAGLLISSYHFLRPGNMSGQMAHYLDTVGPVKGERVVIDHEDASVSLADLKKAVQYLLDQPLDLQVTIYSGHLIKEQVGSAYDAFLAENTALWIAQYTAAASPSWPVNTWKAWSLWQWTDHETIPGISAPVDGNRWNGSIENLKKWWGPAGAEPTPEPEPVPPVVEPARIDMTLAGDVNLYVNGQLVPWR